MSAYLIFDLEIFDLTRYQEFMAGVKPALEAAGGKYLARAGEHRVYEGNWEPSALSFWNSPTLPRFKVSTTGPSIKD